MKLETLLEGITVLEKVNWHPHKTFGKITSDSRALDEGDVFVACRGARMDGHDFLKQAIHAKAAAVIYDHLPDDVVIPSQVTGIRVFNAQPCLAEILNRFYGYPERSVKLVGVTGTNGKTTIAYLLHKLLSRKVAAAYLGTLWYELPSEKIAAINTTPGPEILIPLLNDMRRHKVRYCVMEVSSHALDQFRVHGLEFELAIFTQLTQDHLDYHKNLEAYFHAKRKLFTSMPRPRTSLINRDCPYGRRLMAEIPGALSFSLEGEGDYVARDVQSSLRGNVFNFSRSGREIPFDVSLPMRHNVANLLAVLAALDLLGFDPGEFRDTLECVTGIPGRMELVNPGDDFEIFVDYAHTPDAFEHVLGEARRLAPRRVLTLFGCGGDRDFTKRPIMTGVACRYSDVVVLTTDNPRSEDPEAIIRDMKTGITREQQACVEIHEVLDRQSAIEKIVAMAEPGDVVLLLGKGHEDYQILGEKRVPFDDRLLAKECLKRKNRVFLS